jgi:hypothetical protein
MEWKAFHGYITKMDICVNNRHIYKENVADIDVAKYFSHETMVPEISGIIPFLFINGAEAIVNIKILK